MPARYCLIMLVLVGTGSVLRAEKVPLAPEELKKMASHVVVGRVLAIYQRSEAAGDWEYTKYVAEVRVEACEKGEGISKGELVYVRYWQRAWTGQGRVPPATMGHRGLPKQGEPQRVYLVRDAFDASDGFGTGSNDNGFTVIGANGFERLWDAPQQPKALHRFELDHNLQCVAFAPDGRRLVTNNQMWEAATGKQVRRFEPADGAKTALQQEQCQTAFSPDGKYFATGNANGPILLWDANTGREVWRAFERPTLLGMTPAYHTCVAFTPDGKWLVSGGRDGMIRVWDVGTGKEVRSILWLKPVELMPLSNIKTIGAGHVTSLCVTADGKRIIVFGTEATWRPHSEPPTIFELGTGQRLQRIEIPRAKDEYYYPAVAARSDGQLLVHANGKGVPANSRDGAIVLWDVPTGKEVRRWETDGFGPVAAWSADGRSVATVIRNRVVCWEAATGKPLSEFRGHTKSVTSLAFAPDGKHLLSASWQDKTAYLWICRE